MITEQTQSTEPTSQSTARGGLVRRVVSLIAVALAAMTVTSLFAVPASAAVNQWVMYNTDADRCYDVAVYYGANGRINASTGVWFDFNNDCAWDSLARDVTGDGVIDELWLDHQAPGGAGWDYLVVGNYVFVGQNQTGRFGESISTAYGDWRSSGFTGTTIGGTPPTTGTSAGAFANLMVNLARRSGVAV